MQRYSRPDNRFSPSYARELHPSARVRRADTPRDLPESLRPLDVASIPATREGLPSLAALLARQEHDGFMVLHRGAVVARDIPAGRDGRDTHQINSASKLITACLVGALVVEGSLALDVPMSTYEPKLAGTGYGDVTVTQALDMQSGVHMTFEDEAFALGLHPRQGAVEPIGVRGLVLSRPVPEQRSVGRYASRCADTDAVAMVCEAVMQHPFLSLVEKYVWQPMGARDDADFLLDPFRVPIYNGGMCMSLEDFARLGLMLAHDGVVAGQEVISSAYLDDARTLTPALVDALDGNFYGLTYPGAGYHQTFFLDPERPQATLSYGAFGQLLYVDPSKEAVCVLQSAWAGQHDNVQAWVAALHAAADAAAACATAQTEASTTGLTKCATSCSGQA